MPIEHQPHLSESAIDKLHLLAFLVCPVGKILQSHSIIKQRLVLRSLCLGSVLKWALGVALENVLLVLLALLLAVLEARGGTLLVWLCGGVDLFVALGLGRRGLAAFVASGHFGWLDFAAEEC